MTISVRSEAWTGRPEPKPNAVSRSFIAKFRVWFPVFMRHLLCEGHHFGWRDVCDRCGMTAEALADHAWKFPRRTSYVLIR